MSAVYSLGAAGYSFGAASAAFSATAAAQVCRSATSRAASSRSLGCLLPQPASSACRDSWRQCPVDKPSDADSDDQRRQAPLWLLRRTCVWHVLPSGQPGGRRVDPVVVIVQPKLLSGAGPGGALRSQVHPLRPLEPRSMKKTMVEEDPAYGGKSTLRVNAGGATR